MEGFDINDIIKKVKSILTQPAVFFKEMPKTGGYVEPLIFVGTMGLAAGVVMAILNLIQSVIGTGMGIGASIAILIVVPVMWVIFSFIGAGILFVIWKLMGSTEDYETAYKCTAYISVLAVIGTIVDLIPYIGFLVMLGAQTYYLVLASVNVHNIEAKKAWLVFGIIAAILAIIGISGQMAASKMKSEANKYQNQAEEMQKQIEKMQQEQNKK
jgi:hypothetical protein